MTEAIAQLIFLIIKAILVPVLIVALGGLRDGGWSFGSCGGGCGGSCGGGCGGCGGCG